MVYIPRPPREQYEKVCSLSEIESEKDMSTIINIKCPSMTPLYIPICNQLIKYMEDTTNFDYFTFRNHIYTLLVYNIDVYSSVWYIINHFIKTKQFGTDIVTDVIEHLIKFLHLYNNNHHNIYHIEYFLCYLENVIIENEYEK